MKPGGAVREPGKPIRKPNHTMKNDTTPIRRTRGFSLLELMVVVSIMAMLAAIAFPAMRTSMVNAQMARSTSDARSIVLGLRAFAADNDGLFPVGETREGEPIATSNDAFRVLLPVYIDNERIFAVSRSAWGREADNRIDDPGDILEAGENHFAYIAGLLDTSRSHWPLVVDGTDGSGVYAEDLGRRGGCWEGHKAIVATVGGSASVIRLAGERGGEKFIPREGAPELNALETDYMGDEAVLLDRAGD